MKTNAKNFYVVSGNINGSEDDAFVSKSVSGADTAIIGKVIASLLEMGFVNSDGNFAKVEATVYLQNKKGGNTCSTVYSVNDFGEVKESISGGTHIACITLRRLSSTHTFAEWKVSKTRA